MYELGAELYPVGKPVDALTVTAALGMRRRGSRRVDGADGIWWKRCRRRRMRRLPDIVRARLLRRQIKFCREVEGACFEEGTTGDKALELARAKFWEVGEVVHEEGMSDLIDGADGGVGMRPRGSVRQGRKGWRVCRRRGGG